MKRYLAIGFITIAVIICSIAPPIRANDVTSNVVENTLENSTENTVDNTIENLQEKHQEISSQIDEKKERLEYISSVLPEVMVQLQETNEKIAEYEKQIASLSDEAKNLEGSIANLEQQLQVAEEKYEAQKENFEKRLIVMYESGETTFLDVLLSSSSLPEFISTYFMMSEIASLDTELLTEVEMEKRGIETAKQTLEKQQEQYTKAKDNSIKTAIVLENTRIIKNNYMSQLTEEQLALQQEIDTYYKAMNDIEAEIVMLTTASIGSEYIGGSMVWPVPGYSRITSPFGMRTHPFTGVYKLHTGTDIGAPIGTNFIAANDGVVIKAGWNYAYGNMVIVDHGGGVSTLYAHGSEILVELGQEVQKGEPVLKVGSTGYSTGPHAHFEIRINGEYVDPMNFVKPD